MGPELFGVGAAEAVLVFVIALVLVGPQRFPDLARQSGRWYRIARRYTAEITKDVRAAVNEIEDEVKAGAEDLKEVREIGEQMESGLKETASDLDAIGAEAEQAAADTPSTPATVPQSDKPIPFPQTAGDSAPADEAATVAEEATTRPGATES